MASAKSRAASKKTATTRSRSAAKTSSARKTSVTQTARTAGDNEPGAALVNERASEEARVRAQEAAGGAAQAEKPQKLHPDVEKIILGTDDGEPLSSVNSVPKAEGGMPHDDLVAIRTSLDQARGAGALGQPGQAGHGVGTGTAGLTGPMSDEQIAANEKEYAKRVGR